MNKVILIGHIGQDVEMGDKGQGKFSLATTERWTDKETKERKEKTTWHNIVKWKVGNLAQYLKKGQQISVEGKIENQKYTDKDGNERIYSSVNAMSIELLGSRGNAGGAQDSHQAPKDEDEIPF